jgi:hypothetical protein
LKEGNNTSISTSGKKTPKASQKSTAENFDENVIEGERPTVKKLLAK